MGNRFYTVETEDLTPTKRDTSKARAMAAGILASFENNIGVWDPKEIPAANGVKPSVADVMKFLEKSGFEPPDSIDIREFQPNLDAGATLDQWLTFPLLAVGTEYSVFNGAATPAVALRSKKLVVWYRVQVVTSPLPVSRVIFRRNALITGIPIGQYDLEQMATGQKVDCYLSTPQVWLPNMTYSIGVLASIATGVAAKVIMGNFVFEPAGQISA